MSNKHGDLVSDLCINKIILGSVSLANDHNQHIYTGRSVGWDACVWGWLVVVELEVSRWQLTSAAHGHKKC